MISKSYLPSGVTIDYKCPHNSANSYFEIGFEVPDGKLVFDNGYKFDTIDSGTPTPHERCTVENTSQWYTAANTVAGILRFRDQGVTSCATYTGTETADVHNLSRQCKELNINSYNAAITETTPNQQ